MCLAAVYVERGGAGATGQGAIDAAGAVKELVLDKVQLIEVNGEELTCTDLFGKTVVVRGSIKRVDLANSTVILG